MRRSLLTAVAALLLLAAPRLQAAISVASSQFVSYGDFSQLASAQNLTVAFTVTLNATPSAIRQTMVGQWHSSNAEAAFVVMTNDPNVDEIWVAIGCNGSGAYRLLATSDVNLTNGSTYRIVFRLRDFFSGGDKELKLWVNGSEPSSSVSGAEGACTGVTDSAEGVVVGDVPNDTGGLVSLPGNYSEFAIWTESVPAWVPIAYGKGLSPLVYRTTNSLLYTKLVNTSTGGLRDVWAGLAGTNTSTGDAAHPAMYYASDGR